MGLTWVWNLTQPLVISIHSQRKGEPLDQFRRNMARFCYYIETVFLCMSLFDIFCGCYYIETFRTCLTGYNFFDCLTFVEVQQFCFWYDLGLFSSIWSMACSQCMWSTGALTIRPSAFFSSLPEK